ncbi:MAG: TIGR02301 family protein [Hyphomonadaceae bacterium]|nr:TIGR02301 family protein [Hyphomonadaceae bacterium]
MLLRRAALALCLAALLAAPAVAQPQPAPQSQARGEEWYGEQLQELSEVLGGAHYLRILCQGRGDQRWRDYMRGVIDREPSYRDTLVEGFNRGYRDQETRFPVCDRSASQTEAELRARGLRVANGLSARHGE